MQRPRSKIFITVGLLLLLLIQTYPLYQLNASKPEEPPPSDDDPFKILPPDNMPKRPTVDELPKWPPPPLEGHSYNEYRTWFDEIYNFQLHHALTDEQQKQVWSILEAAHRERYHLDNHSPDPPPTEYSDVNHEETVGSLILEGFLELFFGPLTMPLEFLGEMFTPDNVVGNDWEMPGVVLK